MRTLSLPVLALALAMSSAACKNDSTATPSSAPPVPPPPSVQPPAMNPNAMPPGHPAVPQFGFDPPGAQPAMNPNAMNGNVPLPPSGPLDLEWTDPPGWQRVPPANPMRKAQFVIAKAPGDAQDAELTVFTFGANAGGDVEANITRWTGQVAQPDGRPSSAVAVRASFPVGTFRVSTVEVAGKLGGAPAMGMPQPAPIEQGRLLAAVVETPGGNWFFKMTGPDHTVAAAREAFNAMLQSLRAPGAPAANAAGTDAGSVRDGS